jgi:hypothetical protein
MHGGFSRAETMNFMAAIGPDFKSGFIDEAPVSNADVGRTLAAILGLKVADKGELVGRVFVEAMPQGKTPSVIKHTLRSAPSATGLRTIVAYQQVESTRYFDVAGFPGRTVGLTPDKSAARMGDGHRATASLAQPNIVGSPLVGKCRVGCLELGVDNQQFALVQIAECGFTGRIGAFPDHCRFLVTHLSCTRYWQKLELTSRLVNPCSLSLGALRLRLLFLGQDRL